MSEENGRGIMNDHEEIQKQLPAYAGGDLGSQECQIIEMHLASCPACRAELGDLQTLLRVLRSTPEVEPPPWMTARIMATLKEQQTAKRSWLQRIFFPLYIKLPIEIMALLVVCVSGYYLSRTVESELKQPEVRQLRDIPVQPLPIQERYGSGRVEPPPVSRPKTDQSPPVVPKAAEQPNVQPTPVVPPVYAPAPPAFRKESAAPAVGDEMSPIKAESSAESYDRSRDAVSEKKKTAKGVVKNEAEPLSAAPVGRAAGSSLGKSVPRLTLRISVADSVKAAESIRSAVLSSGAMIVEEPQPHADRIKVIIQAQRSAELFDRLARIGPIVERPLLPGSFQELEITIQW